MADFKVIEKTLQSGSNILEVTDAALNNDSIFEVYTDDVNVIPVNVSVSGTTASITFDSKPTTATGVKIFINNLDGEYLPPMGDRVEITDAQQYGNLICKISVNGEVTEVRSGYISANNVNYDNGYGGISQFEFNNSVTNRFNTLDASDILYDENSTVYSAMGDIDSLTTTSKNLVGAINEVNTKSSGIYYSSSERLVGEWFGEPLYQKTYEFDTITISTGATYTLPLNVPNIKWVVSITGILYSLDANGRSRPLPMVDSNIANQVRLDVNENAVRIITNGSFLNYKPYVTIQYTKES